VGGIATRDIAHAIDRQLNVPVAANPSKKREHFGFLAELFAMHAPASSLITRELLGWEPNHRRLLTDLAEGRYTGRSDTAAE
jgi:hypothetical protein